MTPINFHKKEKPLTSLVSMGGGAAGMQFGGGAAGKTYIEDVYKTDVWEGVSDAAQLLGTGIDYTKGGMVWNKKRTPSVSNNVVIDTLNGPNKALFTNTTQSLNTITAGSEFTNNGFNWASENNFHGNSTTQVSWNFRKATGFFDVVTYTGDGVSGRQIPHNLGCVPGMIMVKKLNDSGGWIVYHNSLGATKHMVLNDTQAQTDDEFWDDTEPTSTHFTVRGSGTNADTITFVAYLFAGGKATTAKAVDLDGTGDYLSLAANSDLELDGDFTIEGWVYVDVNGWGGVRQTFFANSIGWTTNHAGISLMNSGGGDEQNCITVWSDTTRVATSSPVTVTPSDGWTHIAVTRSGSSVRIFKNGAQAGSTVTYSDTFHFGTGATWIGAITMSTGATPEVLDGKISNLRVVRGQALYTSNFNVPSDPLTQTSQGAISSNVKLLCCNGSTTTASTVTPGTITANGDPTVTTTDSIFDDTEGNTFGEEEDQNIIKTGSYVGNGSATGPVIDLGWQPQWIMIKSVDEAEGWIIFDSMRGIIIDGDDKFMYADANTVDQTMEFINLTPTGFKLKATHALANKDDINYIFIAIRSADGYVAKSVEAGTDAFNVVYGNSSSTIPNFPANFPVDMGIYKQPLTTYSWYTHSRLKGGKSLKTDSTDDQSSSNDPDATFDSNAGWGKFGYNTDKVSWMWKRGQSFDVVAYEGVGGGQTVSHSLNKVPEMMWIKNTSYSAGEPWTVYHMGLNGGTNPWEYWLQLNNTDAEQDNSGSFADTAPTATRFTVGNDRRVDFAANNYIAYLFASIDGISKCGYFAGTNSTKDIPLGFTPRFFLLKNIDAGEYWPTHDTVRGFDERLAINNANPQANNNWVTATASGVTLVGNNLPINQSGSNYIYYAHA